MCWKFLTPYQKLCQWIYLLVERSRNFGNWTIDLKPFYNLRQCIATAELRIGYALIFGFGLGFRSGLGWAECFARDNDEVKKCREVKCREMKIRPSAISVVYFLR